MFQGARYRAWSVVNDGRLAAEKSAKTTFAHARNGRGGSASRRSARPVAVHGVGDKNSDTDDAEERGNCIQHGNDP
jgi:hypothetical protein